VAHHSAENTLHGCADRGKLEEVTQLLKSHPDTVNMAVSVIDTLGLSSFYPSPTCPSAHDLAPPPHTHSHTCRLQDPRNGNTALHIAAQNGHMGMLELVMGAGADVNIQNKGGQTGLHMVRILWCSTACVPQANCAHTYMHLAQVIHPPPPTMADITHCGEASIADSTIVGDGTGRRTRTTWTRWLRCSRLQAQMRASCEPLMT